MNGLDLSNNNRQSFAWIGVDFAIVKATEGLGFRDGTMNDWIAGARSVNAMFSCYHFAHPDVNSAKEEADFFLSNSVKGDFGPALDFETRPRVNPLQVMGVKAGVDWANEWLDRVAQVRQQEPFFYSFRDYMRMMVSQGLGDWLLWLSTMVGQPMYQAFAGRPVAIEQWGVVGGVDQNTSYVELKGKDEVAAPITMVMPDDYRDDNDAVIKEHAHRGEVWKSDGIIANHVGSPFLVQLYQYLGIAGPTLIKAEWFDDLTLLPNKSVPSISQQ